MNLMFSLLLSFFAMGFAWQIHQKTNDHKVAEVLRPLAIFLVGSCHLAMQGWSTISRVSWCLLIFWSARRIIFTLATNVKEAQVEFHYQALIKRWHLHDESYLFFYLVQGMYAWVLALPFYFIAKKTGYSWFDMLITTGVLVAIFLELIADLNLHFFKKNGGGGVYQHGLWQLCRHPNYLFSWLAWVGFSSLGVYGMLSILSLFPCLFLFFLYQFYFIPTSEQYLLEKYSHSYRQYQKETPAFIPWWPLG